MSKRNRMQTEMPLVLPFCKFTNPVSRQTENRACSPCWGCTGSTGFWWVLFLNGTAEEELRGLWGCSGLRTSSRREMLRRMDQFILCSQPPAVRGTGKAPSASRASSDIAHVVIRNLLLSICNDRNTTIRDLAVSFFSRTGINLDSVRVRDSKLQF